MDREELHGTDLASPRQPTLGHLAIVQRNRIAASGNLRSHAADDEILAVDDEHEGGTTFDGGKVGERERDGDQGARAESQSNLASHAVPDIVLRVLPQAPQRVFRGAKKRGELVVQDPFDVVLLAEHEGVSGFEKHKVRIPIESVPCTNFLRNHNLALTRHFHDMHRLVRRGLLLKPCPERRESGCERPHRTTPSFNIEASSSLRRNAEECAIERSERTTFSMRAAVLVLVGALLVLVLGLSAPGVRAAGPTLTIISPADHAVIGNGTPVAVIFVVSDFNLTPPGTGGPSPTEGHVDVYVDGLLTMATSQETIELPLASGTYAILLRLVADNGTSLNPDVTSSISVTVTQGPAVGTPRIEISYVEIIYPTPGLVLGRDVTISFRVTDFALVPPGRGEPVPNEGHVAVFLDDVYVMAVTAFRPIPFSDLVDGKHTVTVQLVNDAGRPLTLDASDSVTFQIQFAAIVDINPYLQIAQIILAVAIVFVLFYRGWGRNLLATLSGRVGRKNA